MRRLTQHDRDDRGVVTLLVIGIITVLLLASAAAIDISRYSQENSSAQHSADATALAVATDCVLSPTGVPKPEADYDVYRKIPEQEISPSTPINNASCSGGKITITIEKDVDDGLFRNQDSRVRNQDPEFVHKTAEVQWGTVSSADTIRVTIASCEFSSSILNSATDIYLNLDQPSPNSGCVPPPPGQEASPPGGFGYLNDDGSGSDCMRVTVSNNTVQGGPGNSDHVPDCFETRYENILNDPARGYVDLFVPIYDTVAHNGSDYTYALLGYAAFRMRGYEFNGSTDAGTLRTTNCPDIGPGNERCLHGDFVRMVAPADATSGPSQDFGAQQVFLSS